MAQGDSSSPISTLATATPATPATTGYVSAASTNAVTFAGGPRRLYGITISNPTATAASLKVFNRTTNPVVGTTVPLFTIIASATSSQALNFGALGISLDQGLAFCITAGPLATDTAASVAGVQIVFSYI